MKSKTVFTYFILKISGSFLNFSLHTEYMKNSPVKNCNSLIFIVVYIFHYREGSNLVIPKFGVHPYTCYLQRERNMMSVDTFPV